MTYMVDMVDPDEWEVEVYELQNKIFPEDTIVQPDYGVWWFLFDDQNPVGFANVGPSRSDPESWFLARAGILPEHTGNRLQRPLIRARTEYLEQIGIPKAVTYTMPDNPASSNNLIAEGFRLYRPDVLYADTEALYWRKTIG